MSSHASQANWQSSILRRLGIALFGAVLGTTLLLSAVAAVVNPPRPPLLENHGVETGGLGLTRTDWIRNYGAPILVGAQSGQHTVDGMHIYVTYESIRAGRYEIVRSMRLTLPVPLPDDEAVDAIRRFMPSDIEYRGRKAYIQHLGPRGGDQAMLSDYYFSSTLAQAANPGTDNRTTRGGEVPPIGSIIVTRLDGPQQIDLNLIAVIQ